ncbi:unnamed protein product [Effrenium voratum]|nr:unnamed protein product [Effrenium voratum]
MQGHESAAKVGARFTYVGEVVAYEPDGDSGPEGSELGLDAIFRCSRAVSVASVIWRPYFYATCQVSLPPKEWEVVVPAVDDEVPAAFQSQAWNGEMLCTHCASLCGSYTPKRKYIFNHPIELHLDHSPLPPDAPTDPIPPRMIFQVLRMDAWERHFLEGYTFIDLPQQPGSYDLTGRLWAPLGSFWDRLSAAFCGAFLPLQAPELVAGEQLPRNRSSLRVRSGGLVRVRLQVLRRAPELAEPRRRRGRSRESRQRRESREGLRRRSLRRAAEFSPQPRP